MMTLYEASNILATIRAHHGDATFSEEDARMFRAELMPSMTVEEARRAVAAYYAKPHERWCGAGDVNELVRVERAKHRPSEAQINRECENARLTSEQAWLYRRYRIMGETPSEAQQRALTAPNPLALPPVKPKPKRVGGGFNPGLGASLSQIVGYD